MPLIAGRLSQWASRFAAVPGDGRAADPLLAVLALSIAPLAFVHAGADAAISCLDALFVWRSWRTRDFHWARGPWFIAAVVFWSFIVLRGIATAHPAVAVSSALVWIRFPILVAAVPVLLDAVPALPRSMLCAYSLATVFGCTDAIYEAASGHDLFGWIPPPAGGRLVGPTGKLDIGATLGQIGMPLLALALVTIADRAAAVWRRIAAAMAVAALSSAVFLSGERMVFILYLASAGLAFHVVARLRPRQTCCIVALALLAAVLAAATLPSMRPRVEKTLENLQEGSRTVYLQTPLAGLRVFAAAPLFGVGFRQYRWECPSRQPANLPAEICNIHPHEFWIESLAENGIAGTVPFVSLIVLLLIPICRAWRRWPTEPLLGGAAIAVLVHLWPLATTGSFFVNQREVIFWPLLAFAHGLAGGARAPRSDHYDTGGAIS